MVQYVHQYVYVLSVDLNDDMQFRDSILVLMVVELMIQIDQH